MVLGRKVRNLISQNFNAQVFATEDISTGEKWETKLRNELSTADVVVALLTPGSVASSWVLQEIGAAWALRKPIIPLVTRGDVLNNMPISLEPYQAIELAGVDKPEDVERFLSALDESLAAAHVS
jgi:nucleoside 2-deoxyribosyltransferase